LKARKQSKPRSTRRGRPGRRVAAALAPREVRTSSGTDFYLIDELLTPAEREIRDRVRHFSDHEVVPIINHYWEEAEFPFELIPKLASSASRAAPPRVTAAPASRRWPPG